MKSVALDFRDDAHEIDYVIKSSYGNDSIALIQWMHEYRQRVRSNLKVVVVYNDTGWSSSWWEGRVVKGEKMARSYGFETDRTTSIGMEALVMNKRGWPTSQDRFCTQVLKIQPYLAWMAYHDPNCQATSVCGVRREESFNRAGWPEWVESNPMEDGRKTWSPLVYHTKEERDTLIVRAGWIPLSHRSRECRCVLANREDLKMWSEEDVSDIERVEDRMGFTKKGHPRVMFRPHKKMNAVGIREVIKWAKTDRGKYEPTERAACDSGFCEA